MFRVNTNPISGALVKSLMSCGKLLLTILILTSTTAALAIQEVDPNNTCALAQNVGALSANATLTVNGALKTPPTVPDADFYKFTGGTPGNLFRVSVHGVSDGVDTLTLPMVEALNSTCGVTFTSGAQDPINFEVVVPADGVVVLGVTSCCDFAFTGAGSYAGSYTLAATEIVPVKSISGRAVDSVTGQPISGVFVNLALCQDPACTTGGPLVGFNTTDPLGQFTFTNTFFGTPLDPGTYQVTLEDNSSQRYEPALSTPFSAASGEQKLIPDIAMVLAPVIGSISGRIVDSVTHAPLSGVSAPFAHVFLSGCSLYSCSFVSGFTDGSGRFRFDHDQSGRGIVANASFSLYIAGDQYQQLFSTTGLIGPGANQDLGDIQLVSNPIRFTVLQGCASVPLTGGVCEYKVEITNGIASPVEGAAWATINANGLGSFVGSSVFQTGEPQEMYLAAATKTTRASRTATFEFEVPATVPIYAFICPTFWFGVGEVNPELYAQGSMYDYADCVQRTATGYTPATHEQIEGLRKEAHEHEAKEHALVSPR
jgi:hypothetical protein